MVYVTVTFHYYNEFILLVDSTSRCSIYTISFDDTTACDVTNRSAGHLMWQAGLRAS